VFTCLPHRASAPKVAEARAAGAKVVDLSGDFRLADPVVHDAVYGSFRDATLAEDAVYGLTELARDAVDAADLVANPGCYPTCTTMGLAPLVRRGWVEGPVIVDAKSGVSGAGRSPKTGTLFIAVADDVKPYALGRSHRHVAEIEQMFERLTPDGSRPPSVIFNPHVVPIERGMLATSVVHCPGRNRADVLGAIADDFAHEPLVDVLDDGPARIRAVARTPRAQIGVAEAGQDRFVITSSLDNLGKGAATQALQNANRMFGLPETLGLVPGTPLTPSPETTR
jgi:N-acetyl-gamma-glutamyl-phosphate reductase